MSDHIPIPDPLQTTAARRAAAAPDPPVPGRPDLNREAAPHATPDAPASPSALTDPPDPALAPRAAAADRRDLPRLQTPRRGRRLVPNPATPTPPLTPQQRLLLLDTWQRSGLPAADFAALVGLSKY